ncbi:MAG: extensin family protein [Bauldia sp.]|nr:MAG: extensin family protein [Bauldia sp.]
MRRRGSPLSPAIVVALVLAGCTVTDSILTDALEERPAWRDAEARACMMRIGTTPPVGMTQIAKIGGPGGCGIEAPLQISAFAGGAVAVGPTATLGCPLGEAVDDWLKQSVQPAAVAYFGVAVVGIRQLSNYACRRPMGWRPGQLSEHSYGNALDVAEFKLADGRLVTVEKGWRGASDEQAFLREIAVTGCQRFRTFLGPGVAFHHNHFHVDLAHRGESGADRYCRPLPNVKVPPERAPTGGIWAVADPNRRGRLLTDMPDDVAKEIQDPFGVTKAKPEAEASQ